MKLTAKEIDVLLSALWLARRDRLLKDDDEAYAEIKDFDRLIIKLQKARN